MKKLILPVMAVAGLLLLQSCSKKDFNENGQDSAQKRENWIPGQTIVNGTYKLLYPSGTRGISVVGESAANSAFLELRDHNAERNARNWTITSLGGGYYKIINVKSGRAIDVPLGQTTLGLQIWQYGYTGDNAQQWKIEFISGSGNLYKITNRLTNLVLTRPSGGTANGTTITQNTYNSANNWQKWDLQQVVYRDSVATDFFKRTTGWLNSDGAATTLLNNGKVFWAMADGNVNNMNGSGQVPCGFNTRNSGLVQASVTNWAQGSATTLWNSGYTGFKSLFKEAPLNSDVTWLWPGCGFQPSGNDTAYIYNTRMTVTGGFFAPTGQPVFAKLKTSTSTAVGFKQLENLNGINFGDGFIKHTDGYVYAYGHKMTFIVSDVYVARFPAASPNNNWQFWNGSSWVAGATNAVAIATGTDGPTGTGGWSDHVNVVKINSKYVLLTPEISTACNQGYRIGAAVSSSLTGPFSNRKVIYNIPDRLSGNIPFWYAVHGHPEFNGTTNELLVTYDINGYMPCQDICVGGWADPNYYRPRGIRVPFSIIDPSL